MLFLFKFKINRYLPITFIKLIYFTYNKISLCFLPLYIIGLLLLIFLLNKLYIASTFKVNELMNYNLYGKYILELTPNKFSLTVNKSKTDYKYNKIKKLVEKKNGFILNFNKKRDSLIFEKKNFTDEEYIKVIEMFKSKMS